MFYVKLTKRIKESLGVLQEAHGQETMSRSTVFRWWNNFKEGNTKMVDDSSSGKPSNAITDANI
jgi:hypothetical protein